MINTKDMSAYTKYPNPKLCSTYGYKPDKCNSCKHKKGCDIYSGNEFKKYSIEVAKKRRLNIATYFIMVAIGVLMPVFMIPFKPQSIVFIIMAILVLLLAYFIDGIEKQEIEDRIND